jgi:hypothetical protein
MTNAGLSPKVPVPPIFAFSNIFLSCSSSLIIDAMDLLHSGKLDGFCLVSSDSDF